MKLLFPKHAPRLRDAAWDAYVRRDRILDVMVTLLRTEYMQAIEHIDPTVDTQRWEGTVDGQLAYHLMTFYWRGLIGLDDDNGLIARFFAQAPAALRAHALHIVGRTLYKRREPLPPDDSERCKRLWEWCVAQASTRGAYNDLAPFGLWFASGALDDAWSITQLDKTLRLVPTVESVGGVVKHVATLAQVMPVETSRCMRLILKNDQRIWDLRLWAGSMRVIFAQALAADAETRQATIDTIHRLGASGIDDLRDLLPA